MKKLFLIACLLTNLQLIRAQDNLKQELLREVPNCENVAFNAVRIIVDLQSKSSIDSIPELIERWESFCGETEPLFRAKVLCAIENGTFSEELINPDKFNFYLFSYLDRLDFAKEENTQLVYEYNKIYFSYIPINSEFDLATMLWADQLLAKSTLTPTEEALCLLYSNQVDAFFSKLKSQDELNGTVLKTYYQQQVYNTKRLIEANLGLIFGTTIPQNDLLDVIGPQTIFGIQFGMKKNRSQYDLTMCFRPFKSRQPYLVEYENEMVETNYQFGGYIGLDYAYELFKKNKREIDLLAGIGFDGITAIEGDTNNDEESKSINSLNLNAGIGYRFYLKKMNYIGLQARYNIVNYKNSPGTSLAGNYFSFAVSYNLFGSLRKFRQQEKLRMD